MTFTYNPNIPQPTDFPSNSQSQLLQNFQYLCPSSASTTGITKDHNMVLVNDPLQGDGQHRQVTFRANKVTPGFANGVSVLFPQVDTLGTPQSQVWFDNSGTPAQLTAARKAALINPGDKAVPSVTVGPPYQGVTFLAGNILVQWGNFVVVGTTATVTFNPRFKAGPVPSFSLIASGNGTGAFATVTNATAALSGLLNNATVTWIAVGEAS